jgi:hypothetical protein
MVLFAIISHHLLKISSDDDLFSYIISRICSDPEYFDLLRFVHFEYLSAECLSSFLSSYANSLDLRLWESISRRLISDVCNAVDFRLKDAESVDGVISYLTLKRGENVHHKGIVTITSKSVYTDGALRNVADLISYCPFGSQSKPGQSICWDFHEMRILPTHCTIKSCYLKSRVIEISMAHETWTEIDRKTYIAISRASFGVANSTECRFIRLTQTDRNHAGFFDLCVRALEFFGTLID